MLAIWWNGEADASILGIAPGLKQFTSSHRPTPSLKPAAKSPSGSLRPMTSSTQARAFSPAVVSAANLADGVLVRVLADGLASIIERSHPAAPLRGEAVATIYITYFAFYQGRRRCSDPLGEVGLLPFPFLYTYDLQPASLLLSMPHGAHLRKGRSCKMRHLGGGIYFWKINFGGRTNRVLPDVRKIEISAIEMSKYVGQVLSFCISSGGGPGARKERRAQTGELLCQCIRFVFVVLCTRYPGVSSKGGSFV